MVSKNIPNKLSRRHWLRDAAITATGAAMLPSLLTGCADHQIPPTVGIGNEPLTDFELYSAAQNLLHMNAWIRDIYPYCIEYELYLYSLLKSGTKPSNWKDFIVGVFIKIATEILEAASAGIPGAGPAIAIASAAISTWATGGNTPANLETEFAEFVKGHIQMQIAISDTLLTLADQTDNYKNMRERWKGEIDFNGKKYTLRDLAGSQFPTETKGTAYVAMRTAAYDQFKKYIWNVMILKAGSISYSAAWSFNENFDHKGVSPTAFGRDEHYKTNKPATYLRGWYSSTLNLYYYRYWYFTVDNLELSDAAAKELFKDDSPGNIINPKGLFLRDYVYKQFHTEKPDFFGYHDLRKDIDWGPNGGNAAGFDLPDDFEFTGGYFPELIKR